MPQTLFWVTLISAVSLANSVYYSSCTQSTSRTCTYGTNVTDRLQSLKKGGTDVLSPNNYDAKFFPCQEYNYNCGYLEEESDVLTIANGVQLNLTYAELVNCVPSSPSTTTKIQPYLSSQGESAKCVSTVFPLTLSDAQAQLVLSGYLNRLTSNLSALYNSKKFTIATTWSDLNINIKTAVLEMAKYNMNNNFVESTFWNNFLANNWVQMSNELKANNSLAACPECLHSAYLIDSVTIRCNKYQSINFLVDQSGSIGASAFVYAIKFLETYVTITNDDLSIMSIHFYDSSFDPYIDYGTNRATMLSMINSKYYRSSGTLTGQSINATVEKIKAKTFPKGVPKILVIMTDGNSFDDVYYPSQYARSFGITLFCVGIGANINQTQLLQIAGTLSNVVLITSYASLDKLVYLIQNYFCKQIIDVKINDFIQGNVAVVNTSPSFFRVQRSPIVNQTYKLTINYKTDPQLSNEEVRQSHFDPFPDRFSQFAQTQYYRTDILVKQYYISHAQIYSIPIKKVLAENQYRDYAYVSVAGTSMNFNISLTKCSTPGCTVERRTASSIGNLNSDMNQSGTNNIDISIFIPIGIALGLLALCTFATVAGLRKFSQAPEEQLQGLTKEKPADEIAQPKPEDKISMRSHSSNKSHSNKSHSNKSNKSSKKQSKKGANIEQFT